MASLSEFLLDRIAEDEAVAREASGGTVEGEPGNWKPVSSGDEWAFDPAAPDVELLVALRKGLPRHPPEVMGGYWGALAGWTDEQEDLGQAVAPHIARWDPARVLAECEAKRAIVAEHESFGWNGEREHCGTCVGDEHETLAAWPCATVRALALPYSTHPDYQDWARDVY